MNIECDIVGFLATVEDPNIVNFDSDMEHKTVEVFVNGKLIEEDNLYELELKEKEVEKFLFGQIHFNNEAVSMDEDFRDSAEFRKPVDAIQDAIDSQISIEWEIKRLLKGKHPGHTETWNHLTDRRKLIESKSQGTNSIEILKTNCFRNLTVNEKIICWNEKTVIYGEYMMHSFVDCYVIENILKFIIEYKNIKKNESNINYNINKEKILMDDNEYMPNVTMKCFSPRKSTSEWDFRYIRIDWDSDSQSIGILIGWKSVQNRLSMSEMKSSERIAKS